ncbi:hypothetical protein C8J57DRAFT_1668869 [Mycena rebaudengoi]|nr:hypothetical protein C8J57DRAFT_1668869 [Mycena rebaudengoi]
MLMQTPCLNDALRITEDALRYNLSRTRFETYEVEWLGLQALILVDMGQFLDAETVLREAAQRWDSPNPHRLLAVAESSILRQTGRVDQALLLLENSASSIDVANDTSDTTPSSTWLIYFLFSDLSSTQLDVGQTQNALETAEKAVIKCRELRISHAHKLWPRLATAHALVALSNCLAASGRADEEGLSAAQEAAAIYAGSLWRGFYPWGYQPQEFTSKAYHTLSLRFAASGHPDEALKHAEKAVEEYRELVFLAVRHTPSLASGLRNLASRLWNVDRRDDSITALKEAISLLRGVVDQLPHHLPALADALKQLAEYLSAQGDAAGKGRAFTSLGRKEAEAESDSEFWDAEEGSGSTCEEIVSQGAALAIAAQVEGVQEFQQSGISPLQAEEVPLFSREAQIADTSFSFPEPGTSQTTQQGVVIAQQPEAPGPEQARELTLKDIGSKRVEVNLVKIELKSGPVHIAWWILLGMMGLFCAWSVRK